MLYMFKTFASLFSGHALYYINVFDMMAAFHFTYRPKFLQKCQCVLTDARHSIATSEINFTLLNFSFFFLL